MTDLEWLEMDEEYLAKVRMAMAEAGYPDAKLRLAPARNGQMDIWLDMTKDHKEFAAFWQALQVCAIPTCCFECWREHLPQLCEMFAVPFTKDCGRDRT